MDSHLGLPLVALLVFISLGAKPCAPAGVFTIINYCETTIWPAIIPADKIKVGGGFALAPSQSVVFATPVGWSGRMWGRTGCDFDRSGNGMCRTGACRNALQCLASGEPPATLAEFTLASPDFNDVSLVDGFNLPLLVTPVGGRGRCAPAGCQGDLRGTCPAELAVREGKETVACRSACDVFNEDRYCCRGAYGNSGTCQPTSYSKVFKAACPSAYSYAFDDRSSILTCTGADYTITFCPQRNQSACTYHDNKLVCSGSLEITSSISLMILLLLLDFVFRL